MVSMVSTISMVSNASIVSTVSMASILWPCGLHGFLGCVSCRTMTARHGPLRLLRWLRLWRLRRLLRRLLWRLLWRLRRLWLWQHAIELALQKGGITGSVKVASLQCPCKFWFAGQRPPRVGLRALKILSLVDLASNKFLASAHQMCDFPLVSLEHQPTEGSPKKTSTSQNVPCPVKFDCSSRRGLLAFRKRKHAISACIFSIPFECHAVHVAEPHCNGTVSLASGNYLGRTSALGPVAA